MFVAFDYSMKLFILFSHLLNNSKPNDFFNRVKPAAKHNRNTTMAKYYVILYSF